MNKKIFKYFSIVLLLVIMIVLNACNKTTDKIEVTIGMWPDATDTKSVAMFEVWEERFEADYPEYDIVGQPYTYSTDTFVYMAESGQLPTVFQTWFTEPKKLINSGYVKDITDMLVELEWYDKMDESMKALLSVDDKCYGIPRDGYGLGMIINLDVLVEYGLLEEDDNHNVILHDENGDPLYPTTFTEVQELSIQLNDLSDGEIKGFMILSSNKNGGWQFTNIAWNYGADFEIEDNGSWVSGVSSSSSIKAMQWIQNMKHEYECLPNETQLAYNDWWQKIGNGTVAMCIVGSDAITTVYENYNYSVDELHVAFVPMPAGDTGEQYSLFGGTPYMFNADATDEEVKGAMLFLEYMGRSPELSEASKLAMQEGMQVTINKGLPVLPDISPWINKDYIEYKDMLQETWCNVNMEYFEDFYNTFDEIKRFEEPNYSQELYEILDDVLQDILGPEGINKSVESLLKSANDKFQKTYLDKLNN